MTDFIFSVLMCDGCVQNPSFLQSLQQSNPRITHEIHFRLVLKPCVKKKERHNIPSKLHKNIANRELHLHLRGSKTGFPHTSRNKALLNLSIWPHGDDKLLQMLPFFSFLFAILSLWDLAEIQVVNLKQVCKWFTEIEAKNGIKRNTVKSNVAFSSEQYYFTEG